MISYRGDAIFLDEAGSRTPEIPANIAVFAGVLKDEKPGPEADGGGIHRWRKRRKLHRFEKADACPKADMRRLIEAHVRLTEAMQPRLRFAYAKSKSFRLPTV